MTSGATFDTDTLAITAAVGLLVLLSLPRYNLHQSKLAVSWAFEPKDARTMIRALIAWSVGNPLIVLLGVAILAGVGAYSFLNVNVEAYPDPAPPIIEVVAQYPGCSAEEVERQVTIPLEIALAGMPGLKYTRSKSLFGLSHLRNQFDYGIDFYKARQEVINRLSAMRDLPTGITAQISPVTPTGELVRYTLASPKDSTGQDLYTLTDLKAIQDWTLEREFKRVPGVVDVVSFGEQVKRYEVRPDPDRMQGYGIPLAQLQNAIANSNSNIGGDYLFQGPNVLNVRGLGLFGAGRDPMQQVLGQKNARAAVAFLRAEEARRVRQIRQVVVAAVNNQPILVDQLVEGGPAREGKGRQGVVVSYQTRLGKVSRSVPDPDSPDGWCDEEDKVMGIVLMRKNENSLPTLERIKDKIYELNTTPGRLPPGVELQTHFDLSRLIHLTTETVRENLIIGMTLVTLILLMFLSNVRSALIVAVNVPLALLFAFSVLFLRGKSANLLSIGAVDFGIIVDSTVIMVENIYRSLSSGERAELPLKDRILRASQEVEKALLYSTAIMVCAFIPLFTMSGPEGQIFGPMADTYAFALGGALLLALTLAPVLCLLLFRNLKPTRDNFLVRWIKAGYLQQLSFCLRYRIVALAILVLILLATVAVLPFVGHEFMPELEEGNVYVRGTFPVNISLDEAAEKVRIARAIMRSFSEVELVQSQVGRPDDGTDPSGYYNTEYHVPLKPESAWPRDKEQEGWKVRFWPMRRRSKLELVEDMKAKLKKFLPGVDWNFSQYIRDNVMESLSGVKGDNSVKIIGPDLDELEKLAEQVKTAMETVPGIEDVGIFRIKGQPNLELPVDRDKCSRWNINPADVHNVIQSALAGRTFTQMTEGEKSFDITLRWPERLRNNLDAILQIPVDVQGNMITPSLTPGTSPTPVTGASVGISAVGAAPAMPAKTGSIYGGTFNDLSATPRRRLGDLVTPQDESGYPDPTGSFIRSGASLIYREQGNRLIAVKFSVRGRDLAGAVAEAQQKSARLFQPPYRAEWSGEFEEMEAAERRLLVWVPLSFVLIFLLLYLAFHSFLDTLVVCSNVVGMCLGGVWGLLLTGTIFNISAAVGFISILGVAIMNGLLMVSSFNALRARGVPLREAVMEETAKLIRPVTMTALAAIFGLLPAALSARIGSQSQRPLAIVVVGGMIATLLLTNLVPVLYSLYGKREPPASAGELAH
jgi:cobalt-zinc-cadmium resistance protein CzcA